MNPKIVARSALVAGLALWLALTLVASAQGPHPDALSAPAGPPLPSAPGLPRPEAWQQQRAAGRTVAPAPSETLGQPALNYHAVRTYGIPGEPYLDTPNHLFEPAGLFVDGDDHLYAIEQSGDRLLKYDTDGSILLKIGKAGACQDLCGPRDVAVAGDDNIWVTEQQELVKLEPDGDLIWRIPWSGEPAGFGDLSGLIFDSQGRMFVADRGNHRVLVYKLDGAGWPIYTATIGVTGGPGSDNDHFEDPDDLAIDSLDRIYVADVGNHRIQRCVESTLEEWTCSVFKAVPDSGDYSGLSVWVDGADNVYITHRSARKVLKCNSAGACNEAFISEAALGLEPADVAVDSGGNVFVAYNDDFTIRKYNAGGAAVGAFAGHPGVPYTTDANHIAGTAGIHLDAQGHILFTAGGQLIKMDTAGNRDWAYGVPGVIRWDEEGYLFGPEGMDTAPNGDIYVTSQLAVAIIHSNGTYSQSFGTGCCGGEYGFWFAVDVAIDQLTGTIYVVDGGYHRVQVYNSSLVYLTTLGEEGVPGSDDYHFEYPRAVEIDGDGNIYVADHGNCRVQKYNRARVYQRTFGLTGHCGDGYGELPEVNDVAVDGQGRVFIADRQRVVVYDRDGAILGTIGGGLGWRLYVDTDGAGNVYVGDRDHFRIQTFAADVPGWRQVNIDGFGSRGQMVSTLTAFDSSLYAGTWSSQVWRTPDGRTWTQATPAWTSPNPSVVDGEVFGAHLYLGVSVGENSGPWTGEVWRTDGTSWEQVAVAGFGDPSNSSVAALGAFDGNLYAATGNEDTGTEIWRSPTGNANTWTQVNPDGFGAGGTPPGDQVMDEFGGYLYVGLSRNGGAELWRTSNGATWTPALANGPGLNNTHVSAMAEFGGQFYIGLRNVVTGGEVWRSSDGLHWAPVVTAGLGDPNNQRPYGLIAYGGQLYLVFANQATGAEVWRTSTGDTRDWTQVADAGWGDSDNGLADYFDKAAAVFGNRLYVGTENWTNGGEVWMTLMKDIYLPLVRRSP
jgi:hypothetical protein